MSLEIATPNETPGGAKPKTARSTHSMPSEFRSVVRWESGLPVRLARKTATLPDKGVGQYILSISRLPLEFIEQASANGTVTHGRGAELDKTALAELVTKGTTLQRLGKDSIAAIHSEWVESDFSPRVVIFFPPGAKPIQMEYRDVDLVSAFGGLLLRAKFSLKEMVYRDKLEL